MISAEQILAKNKLFEGLQPFIDILIEVEQLPLKHKIVFFSSCCERILPIYQLVSGEPGWGDISILRSAVDEIWSISAGQNFSNETIFNLIQKIDNIFLDCEHDDEYDLVRDNCKYAEMANEVHSFIFWILKLIDCDNSDMVIKLHIDLIYILHQYLHDSCLVEELSKGTTSMAAKNEIFLKNELTKLELEKELLDLKYIKNVSEFTSQTLSNFRANASFNNMSILGSIDDVRIILDKVFC